MPKEPIRIRIWQKLGDGSALCTDVELPAKTGDEGFAFLDAMSRRVGDPKDDARDKRWRALRMAEAELKRKERK